MPSRPEYLFDVGNLGTVFRARFCEGLQGLYAHGQLQFHGQLQPLAGQRNFQQLMRAATRHPWVVYSKRPFAGPEQGNRGRQQRLEQARALLGLAAAEPQTSTLEPGKAPEPAPWPRCPHCGWAALILVRVIPPQRSGPGPCDHRQLVNSRPANSHATSRRSRFEGAVDGSFCLR